MTDDKIEFEVRLSRESGYKFVVEFPGTESPTLNVDEDPPLGEGKGPDPARLLSAAVSHCLISSFLFCMGKSRAAVEQVTARTRITLGRNDENRLRVSHIDVEINAVVSEADRSKFERCIRVFPDFCTVSQSVKSGVPINVTLNAKDRLDL